MKGGKNMSNKIVYTYDEIGNLLEKNPQLIDNIRILEQEEYLESEINHKRQKISFEINPSSDFFMLTKRLLKKAD